MKRVNEIIKIFALLLVIILFFKCEKEYIPHDNSHSNSHRSDDRTINCLSNIMDWSGLMTDSLLTTATIPSIPSVDSNYISWLSNKYNRIDIRSLTSEKFSDLQCLKQYLGNRKLVQLGESSHGTKEYSQIKVRLIKFLHEQMGFDVIAFESGFFDCYLTNQNIGQLSEIQAMENSIFFGVWGTTDVKELFTYLKTSGSTDRPLTLAGFDCQFSSNNILNHPAVLYEIISKADVQFAIMQRIFDSLTIRRLIYFSKQYFTEYRDSIKQNYQKIINFLDDHADQLIESFPQKPVYPLFLKQSITSITSFIDEQLFNDNSLSGNPTAYKIRDSAMAANVMFLKEKLYPDKKIILWAHNYHIANSQFQHALYPDNKNMGSWLYERYKNDLYTIGLYMQRGTTKTDWDWSIINIPPPISSNSLETILYYARKKYLFIDLLNHPYSSGNKWMYTTISAKTSGFANESMILKDVYNGIVFIDSSSVPIYLK